MQGDSVRFNLYGGHFKRTIKIQQQYALPLAGGGLDDAALSELNILLERLT
jgi:hypothetical protein